MAVASCAPIPKLPKESQLPVQEILEHVTCELRSALKSDQLKQYADFHPDQWSVAISLNPQVDTDFNINAGTGFKTNDSPPVTHIWSWVVGPGTGLQYDVKTHNEGTIGYVLKTSKLLTAPISDNCSSLVETAPLTHRIGVDEWLERSVPKGDITPGIAGANKLLFRTTLTFKFNGTGAGVTWTVPRGSAYGSLAGSYQSQQDLQIQFIPETPPPQPLVVVTLPDDGHASAQSLRLIEQQVRTTKQIHEPGSIAGVSPSSQQRLDLLQLEQAIRSLRIQAQ